VFIPIFTLNIKYILILLNFVQRKDIFICDFINLVKVYKGWLILYIVKTTLPLTMMNSNSFKGGYKVIMHKSTQNGSQTTTHIQVDTCSVLLVTQVAFAHVLQLVKTKSKNKLFNPFEFFSRGKFHCAMIWTNTCI
jgi:hypothetical protein